MSADPLLATMSFGAVVVNYNRSPDEIFSMLERYTEELIFVFFFTLSGMHLNLRYLEGASLWIALFVVLRTAGKFLGAFAGSLLGDAPKLVQKYAFLGLLPQGGVVIGLALALRYTEGLTDLADAILAVVIGATVVHEILGPIASRAAIRGAGEAKL